MAGVAWSVPVIATAIAAPAAAASGYSATAALVGQASNISLVSSSTGQGTSRQGTGPTGFSITNAGTAITGPITGTLNIKPTGTVTAGAGIQSLTPGTLVAANPAYTGTFEYNATFTYAGGITSGQTLNFPMSFQYQRVSPAPNKQTFTYALTITLRLPDGTDRIMAGTLTVTY
jgi:hypothetical protein